MKKKRLKPLQDEFYRLIIYEGYNDYEAIAIIIFRFLEVLIPVFVLLYVTIRQNNRTK